MAFALVGSLGTPLFLAGQPAFGQATTSGNLLVCWVTKTGANPVTCSDSNWALVAGFNATTSSAQVWYRPNCGAGETAPTFSGTGISWLMLGEFSGGATSSPTDQIGEATGATSPQTATAAGADVAAGELVIGVEYVGLSKAGTHTSALTFNNGASATGNANNDAESITLHYRFAYGITTGNAGADTLQGTSSSMNLASVSVALASFKLASEVIVVPGWPPLIVPNVAVQDRSRW